MLREVPRISADEARRDFRKIVSRQSPVIIQNLYPDESLMSVDSAARMAEELAAEEIAIGPNYFEKFLMNDPEKPKIKDYRITVGKYLKLIDQFPDIDFLCREQRLSDGLKKRFRPSSIVDQLADSEPTQMFYVANDGTSAPMHFDGDYRDVLFTQIVGKKNVYLVEPGFGARLNPIKNFCGIPLHQMSEREKEDFLAFNQAYHCILKPKETLYMPKLWWHQLENIGITMATSMRFGTSPHSRMMRTLPLNYLTQNIVKNLLDPVTGQASDETILLELLTVNFAAYPSAEKRIEAVLKALKEAYGKLCPFAVQTPYLSEWFEYEVKKDFKKYQFMYGFYHVKRFTDGELSERCSPVEVGELQACIEDQAYTKYLSLSCNLLGLTEDLGQLSRLQATVLLNFLSLSKFFGESIINRGPAHQPQPAP